MIQCPLIMEKHLHSFCFNVNVRPATIKTSPIGVHTLRMTSSAYLKEHNNDNCVCRMPISMSDFSMGKIEYNYNYVHPFRLYCH